MKHDKDIGFPQWHEAEPDYRPIGERREHPRVLSNLMISVAIFLIVWMPVRTLGAWLNDHSSLVLQLLGF